MPQRDTLSSDKAYDPSCNWTKAELMSYRQPKDGFECTFDHEGNRNTLLHEAIIKGDSEFAKRLVELDKEDNPRGTIINNMVWGNTPLMLALKTGQFEVVKAILQHRCVSANKCDNNGLLPIHWAALFRQDAIIERLITKLSYVALQPAKYDWEATQVLGFSYLKPSHLYKLSWGTLDTLSIPASIADHHDGALFLASRNVGLDTDGITNSPPCDSESGNTWAEFEKHLVALHAPYLSDLLFHAKAVAQNHCLISCPSFNEEYQSSSEGYQHEFKEAYPHIRNSREAKPVIASTLEKLISREKLFSGMARQFAPNLASSKCQEQNRVMHLQNECTHFENLRLSR